jgi:hypothetical protein
VVLDFAWAWLDFPFFDEARERSYRDVYPRSDPNVLDLVGANEMTDFAFRHSNALSQLFWRLQPLFHASPRLCHPIDMRRSFTSAAEVHLEPDRRRLRPISSRADLIGRFAL